MDTPCMSCGYLTREPAPEKCLHKSNHRVTQFRCPDCGIISSNPNDLADGYCGRCHWWTGDPKLAPYKPT